MKTWEPFEAGRVIADDEGKVLFNVQPGSVIGAPSEGGELASLLITSNDIESSYELQDRVMAALRTQELERAESRQIVPGPDGRDYIELTRHSNGKKSVMEIKWLDGKPKEEEIELIKAKLIELANEFSAK